MLAYQYLLNSPQSSLTTDRLPELFETTSTSFSSPSFPHISKDHPSSPFVPSLPHQPITTPQIPITHIIPTLLVVPNPHVTPSLVLNPIQLTAMALIYARLVMPAPQGALPTNYQSKITLFDGIGTYTTHQHTNKMIDYFELHEIDIGDVHMRIFVQTLAEEVRTCFR